MSNILNETMREEMILSAIAQSITGNHSLMVRIGDIAPGCTDGNVIHVGSDEYLKRVFGFKCDYFLFRLHLVVHETLHCVFTPFNYFESIVNRLHQESFVEGLNWPITVIHNCLNMLEDIFIEAIVRTVFDGWLLEGFLYGSEIVQKNAKEISGDTPLAEWFSACIQYRDCLNAEGQKIKGNFNFPEAKKCFEMVLESFQTSDKGYFENPHWRGDLFESLARKVLTELYENKDQDVPEDIQNFVSQQRGYHNTPERTKAPEFPDVEEYTPSKDGDSEGSDDAEGANGAGNTEDSDEFGNAEESNETGSAEGSEKADNTEGSNGSDESGGTEGSNEIGSAKDSNGSDSAEDSAESGSSNCSDDVEGSNGAGSANESEDTESSNGTGEGSNGTEDSNRTNNAEGSDGSEDADASDGTERESSDDKDTSKSSTKSQKMLDSEDFEPDDKSTFSEKKLSELRKRATQFSERFSGDTSVNNYDSLRRNPEYQDYYDGVVRKNKSIIKSIESTFRKYVKNVQDEMLYASSGKYDPLKAETDGHRTINVFKARKNEGTSKDAAILVSLDESESMESCGLTKEAANLSISLIEAFSSFNELNVQVEGWMALWGEDPAINLYKSFSSKEKLGICNSLKGRESYTPLGFGLKHATESLLKRRESNRIFIMVTDGEPWCPYTPEFADPVKIRQQVLKMRRSGILPIILVIGDLGEFAYYHSLFGDSFIAIDPHDEKWVRKLAPKLKKAAEMLS